MEVKKQGELPSKIELNVLKKENEEPKKALGESASHITILKKVRVELTTKQKIESLAKEHGLSLNMTIITLVISPSTVFYKKKRYPKREIFQR